MTEAHFISRWEILAWRVFLLRALRKHFLNKRRIWHYDGTPIVPSNDLEGETVAEDITIIQEILRKSLLGDKE